MLSPGVRARISANGRALFRAIGLEVHRTARRPKPALLRLLQKFGVDVVLDVGANVGQFGNSLREFGYAGRIVSFEPLSAAYAQLVRRSAGDPRWETYNFALGDFDGEAEINRSAESQLSSFFEQTVVTGQVFREATVLARETVRVRPLDAVFGEVCRRAEIVLLKIDTQGFERRVLDGAKASIGAIAGAHVELSYVPLYEDQMTAEAMIEYLSQLGFRLVRLEPMFFDGEGARVIEADGTFFRFT